MSCSLAKNQMVTKQCHRKNVYTMSCSLAKNQMVTKHGEAWEE